jgi:hypothetical protein
MVVDGTLIYVEYFKSHRASAAQIGALRLSQSRGQYGPEPLQGHVLGLGSKDVLPEIALGAFDPIGVIMLLASIHRPIRGNPVVVIDNWLRPALRRRLADVQWDHPFQSNGLSRLLNDVRIGSASGRLETECQGRRFAIDLINGRALREPRWDDSTRRCADGNARLRAFRLDARSLSAISESVSDPSYYLEL